MKTKLLLYYKTKDDIDSYRKKSVVDRLKWLEAQMKFFHKAMPEKAKKNRERFERGEI